MGQPSLLSTMPFDPLTVIFSYTNSNYTSLIQVNKHWNSCLEQNGELLFWKPIYDEIFPSNVQPSNGAEVPPKFQALIKAFFQHNRGHIETIIKLIKDDAELAKCLHTNDWSLKEFKNQPSFQRSRLLWSAMHRDATPVILRLLEETFPLFLGVATPEGIIYVDEEDFNAEFNHRNPYRPVILSLIEQHKVPFDKAEFICALLPWTSLLDFALPTIFKFIKSHEDLSKVKNLSYIHPYGDHPVAAFQNLIGLCEHHNAGITHEDLMLCKLKE